VTHDGTNTELFSVVAGAQRPMMYSTGPTEGRSMWQPSERPSPEIQQCLWLTLMFTFTILWK